MTTPAAAGLDPRPGRTRFPGAELLLLLVLAAVASLWMGFRPSIFPVSPGRDESWVWAYHYATVHGLDWGSGFVSTFGPYGYLLFTVNVGDFVSRRMAAEVVLAVLSGAAAAAYVQTRVAALGVAARAGLTLVVVYAIAMHFTEYHWFALFILLALLGLHGGGARGLAAHGAAGMLAGFCLLIKFSVGFGAVMSLAVCSLLGGRPVTVAARLAVGAAGAVAGASIGWWGHRGTLAGLVSYLVTGWHVSTGYSSAMSLVPEGWWTDVISFAVFLLLLAAWTVSLRDRAALRSLVALAFPLFAVWKHSMVRQASHMTILVGFGLIVLAIVLVDSMAAVEWRRALAGCALLLVPLGLPWFAAESRALDSPGALRSIGAALARPFGTDGARGLLALRDIRFYGEWLARRSDAALRSRRLPDSLRTALGATPVDVYPWELSYLPANGLRWVNRPMPASYGAYTPMLDDLNAEFFRSGGRPRYMLWHTDIGVESLDGRHLFWDEPRTLRSILTHYDLVGTAPGVGLLVARSAPRYGAIVRLGTASAEWGQWVAVPQTDGVLLADVAIRRSIAMWLVRTAFREDPVWLSVRFAAGEERTYRVVPDNMANGLWISPLPVDRDELVAVLNGGAGRRVAAVRFHGAGLFQALVRPPVITWSRLTS
jgi:hypothetical protein